MTFTRLWFWLLLFLSLSTIAPAQQVTKTDIDVLATKVSHLETTVNKIDNRLGSVDISISRMRETQLLSGSRLKTETAFPNGSKACWD